MWHLLYIATIHIPNILLYNIQTDSIRTFTPASCPVVYIQPLARSSGNLDVVHFIERLLEGSIYFAQTPLPPPRKQLQHYNFLYPPAGPGQESLGQFIHCNGLHYNMSWRTKPRSFFFSDSLLVGVIDSKPIFMGTSSAGTQAHRHINGTIYRRDATNGQGTHTHSELIGLSKLNFDGGAATWQ